MALIRISGDISGHVDLEAPAIAGEVTVTLPGSNGVMVTHDAAAVVSNGSLLIGNTVSGGFDVNTLTQGTGILITNDKGSITVAATGGSALDQFARDQANAAFDKANTANVTGQAAFDKANGAIYTAAQIRANISNTAPINYEPTTGVISHALSGATASGYGDAATVAKVVVDSNGHVTSVSNTSIAISASQVTSGTLAVARGGTGQTAITVNGSFLIGNTVSGGFDVNAITPGTNMTVTNDKGSITLSSSDAFAQAQANAAFNQANLAYANANTAIYTSAQIRANISNTAPIRYDATTGIVSHADSGVTPSGYGDAATIPVFVANATGHISSVVNTAIAISTTQITSGTLAVGRGGTGQTAASLVNGAVLIGNTVSGGYDLNRLTQGTGIEITNDKGSITIAATGGSAIDQYARDTANGAFTQANNAYANANTAIYTAAQIRANISNTAPINYDAATGIVSHALSGATASGYGDAATVAKVVVDSNGHVTSVTNTSIAISASAITSGTLAIARGGTGQTAITVNGSLLIGNTVSGGFDVNPITSGTNITISNDKGSITIASSDAFAQSQANAAYERANAAYANANTAIYTATQIRANISNTAPINYEPTTGVVSHADSGVVATGHGDAATIPKIVVNATGHVTSVTNTAVAISASQITSGTLAVARGGTGQTAITVNGSLLIGNTVSGGFDVNPITQGTNITITNDKGSITIASSDAFAQAQANAAFNQANLAYANANTAIYTATQIRANISNTAPIRYDATTGIISHADSGVVASGYGDAATIPVFVANVSGHISSVTNTAIAISATQVTSGTLAVARGGTAQTAINGNGSLLIGNTVSGGFDVNVLTPGTNITITNDKGSVTIASSDAFAQIQANAAFNHANGAFAHANGAFNQANTPPANTAVAGAVQFNNSGLLGGSSKLVWNNEFGRLGIGAAATAARFELRSTRDYGDPNNTFFDSTHFIIGPGDEYPRIEIRSAGEDAVADQSGAIYFLRSRGTHSVPSNTIAGQIIGTFYARGYFNGNNPTVAQLEMIQTANGTSDGTAGAFVFKTNNGTDGGTPGSPGERMRITSQGYVGVANSTPSHNISISGNAWIRETLTLRSGIQDATGSVGSVGGVMSSNGSAVLWKSASANGQLLIGNTVSSGFDVATLTQGTGIVITNTKGAIEIAATGGSATDQFARDTANGAYAHANGAFNRANTPPSNTAAAGAIQFNNAGAFGGSANIVWDNANTGLSIGTNGFSTANVSNGALHLNSARLYGDAGLTFYESTLSITGKADEYPRVEIWSYSQGDPINTETPGLLFHVNAGVPGASANTLIGHYLGSIGGRGTNGAANPDLIDAARIDFIQAGNASSQGIPATITFSTSDGLQAGAPERMRITQNGDVLIGRTTNNHDNNFDQLAIGNTAGGMIVLHIKGIANANMYASNTGFNSEVRGDHDMGATGNVYITSGAYQGAGVTNGTITLWTGNPTNSERMRITKDGYVGIGTTEPGTHLHVEVDDDGSQGYTGLGMTHYSGGDTAADVEFFGQASRGTKASPTAIKTGDVLFTMGGGGHTGVGFTTNRVWVTMFASQDWSAANNGTKIQFATTSNNATAPGTRMAIDHQGHVGIANNFPAHRLSVSGNVFIRDTLTLRDGIQDSTGSTGSANGLLTSNGTAVLWKSASANGQLLIGNTVSGGFDLNTLTQGTNITITNDKGAITIASSDAFAQTQANAAFAKANAIHKSITVPSPLVTDNITFFFTDVALTFNKIVSVVRGSATPNVVFLLSYESSRHTGADRTNIVNNVTCANTTNGVFTTTFANATVPANNYVTLTCSTVSGTVDELHVSMFG